MPRKNNNGRLQQDNGAKAAYKENTGLSDRTKKVVATTRNRPDTVVTPQHSGDRAGTEWSEVWPELVTKLEQATRKDRRREGAPTRYDPSRHPRIVFCLAYAGCTIEEIEWLLGSGASSIESDVWARKHEEFRLSLEKGQSDPNLQVVSALLRTALGERDIATGRYVLYPQVDAQKFFLTNRLRNEWRNVQHVGVGQPGADGGVEPMQRIQLSKLTDDELAVFEKLLAKATSTDAIDVTGEVTDETRKRPALATVAKPMTAKERRANLPSRWSKKL